MTQKKKPPRSQLKRNIGIAALVALLAVAGVFGVRVARLYTQVQVEAATTPSPEPVGGNVMAVTLDPSAPTPEPMLRKGATGDEVSALQGRLQELGYYSGEIDGQYGQGTAAAVKLFQEQNGLGADGVFGGESRALLYSAEAKAMTVTPTPVPTDTPAPTEVITPGLTADGMPLLVNKNSPLPGDYACVDLVNLTDYCDASVVKIKANGIEGERMAVDAMMDMLRAAENDGVDNWQVSAGWRSVAYQQQLLDNKAAEYRKNGLSSSKALSAALKTVAEPGTSEHHTGLAFDITVPGVSFKGTKQCVWIWAHCWEYGFILRYPEGKEDVTGFTAEAWHFRYVGTEHSLIMRDEDLCLEEYIAQYGAA